MNSFNNLPSALRSEVLFTEEGFAGTYYKGPGWLADYRQFLEEKPRDTKGFKRLSEQRGFSSSWETVKGWYRRAQVPFVYGGTEWCVNAGILTEGEYGTAFRTDNDKFRILNELAAYTVFSGSVAETLTRHVISGCEESLNHLKSRLKEKRLQSTVFDMNHTTGGVRGKSYYLKVDDGTETGTRMARVMYLMTGTKGANKENLERLPGYLRQVDSEARRDFLRALYECRGYYSRYDYSRGPHNDPRATLKIDIPVLANKERSAALSDEVKTLIEDESGIRMKTSVFSSGGSSVYTTSKKHGDAFLNYLTDNGETELLKL